MTYRVRNIALAVGLALLAALLTTFYVTNYKKRVDSQQETVTVLVAKQDIPAGTPGSEVIKKNMVAPQDVARNAVVPGAFTDSGQIGTLIANQQVYAREQVTASRFGAAASAGVRSKVTGTYRVVQVSGDQNQLLVGTLKAGDHIDFVGNIKVADELSSKHFARVVLRDLLVLKVSGSLEGAAKIAAGPNSQSWVMLRVTDAQSQKLFFVYANNDWTLTLRPTLNAADSPNDLDDAITVVSDGVKQAEEKIIKGFMLGAKFDESAEGGPR